MSTIVHFVSGSSVIVKEDVDEVRGKLKRSRTIDVRLTLKTDEPIYVNPTHVEHLRSKAKRKATSMPRSSR